MDIQTIQSTYPSAIWFDSSYSGTESGTFAQPYNTFTEAFTAVSSGGAIAVKSGTHQDNLVNLNKSITIVGTGHDAILEKAADGISITADVTFLDLGLKTTFSGSGSNFMVLSLGTYTVTIKGCKLYNTNSALEGFISGYNNASGNLSVSNSIFELQTTTSLGAVLRTWNYGSLGDITFNNCTIKLTGGTSTSFLGAIKYATSVSTTKNCIFVGNTGSETIYTSTTGTVVDSNNCYHNTAHSGGTNNVFSDPLFVDSTTGDYRLRPSSPCINAGTAS